MKDQQGGTQGDVTTYFGASCIFIKKLLRQQQETDSVAPTVRFGGYGAKLEKRDNGKGYGDILRM
jgi:hypothetical protein